MSTHPHPDPLDRILLAEETLLPSSGFATSVMEAVQEQAAVPAPISIPWKLLLPGIAAVVGGLAFLCWLFFLTLRDMIKAPAPNWLVLPDWLAWLSSGSQSAVVLRTQAAPVLLALAASLACIVLCRKLAAGWSAR